MRQPTGISQRRHTAVGVATEPVSAFGRSILRGVIRYANLQRNWILHKDMWWVNAAHWPECDGTILGGVKPGMLAAIKEHSRHLITCSGGYDPAEMPVICLDDDATGAMAAEHLMEKGFKHFGFYGPEWASDYSLTERPLLTFTRRVRGFQEALREQGFSCIASNVTPAYEDLLTHTHHPRVIEWLQSLPTPIGIMAVDDSHASDLAEACRKAHVGVPDHVAIIGINNDDLLCEGAWPPLTSVECNFSRMSYLAAKMLDRMMKGEALGPEERLVQLPPVRVQQRMSTDVLAIDQPDVIEAVRFIREHACDPCSIQDVMQAIPVSRRTLERQFANCLGRTLHEEVVRVRIDTARRLLTQSDLPVDEVSQRCGFAAVQSFIRFFRHGAGITPAAFRRRSLPKSSTQTHRSTHVANG